MRLHEQRGLTILMVNHDLPAMRRYVNDVIWIHDGRLLRGPVDDLLRGDTVDELPGPSPR